MWTALCHTHMAATELESDGCGQHSATTMLQAERESKALLLASACDRNRDGFLNEEEMWEFAIRCGAGEYSPTGWNNEYIQMSKEFDFNRWRGMPVARAADLLHDRSPSGVYLTDKELLSAVARVQDDQLRERVLRCSSRDRPDRRARAELVVIGSVARIKWCSDIAGLE